MLSLPPILGRFPVGITTFVTPVRPAKFIGSARVKRPHSSSPSESMVDHALQLEEVAFTAYYPADISKNPSKGVDWLVRPLKESLLGLYAYLGISTWLLWPAVYLFGSFIKIPAYRNAPLLHPKKAHDRSEEQWPLVIFSHGLGGGRTMYSQFCSRLAASGKVVLALEHRDGTGMACKPRTWVADGKTAHRPLVYLRETDVYWENDRPQNDYPKPLRGEQLAFRHHEVYIAYQTFQKFLSGDSQIELETIDGSSFNKASWSNVASSGSSIIRHHENVILAGHSFGGATVLSLLATKPVENYERIPVSKAILLDPWLEPLPTPGPAPYSVKSESNGELLSAEASIQSSLKGTAVGTDTDSLIESAGQLPRMFVINSETFTVWKDHFTRLQEVIAAWEPQGHRIITLVGGKHISFSDIPILPVFRHLNKYAIGFLDTICRLSLAFIHDELDEMLEEERPATKIDIEIIGTKPDGKPKKKLVGNIGEIIVS